MSILALLSGYKATLSRARRRNVLGDSMKFKIEIEAVKERIKKHYVIEASDTKEFLMELSRIEREWITETGILNFTTTVVRTE